MAGIAVRFSEENEAAARRQRKSGNLSTGQKFDNSSQLKTFSFA
jgi:hypothetical protein